jgi:membrane associated rhomboid family serine protease
VSVYALTAYGVAHRQSMLALGLFVVAAVVIGAAAGWTGWMRLASVIAPFLTNLRVTPSDPRPLVVTGGVLLLTALGIVFAAARRPTPAGR